VPTADPGPTDAQRAAAIAAAHDEAEAAGEPLYQDPETGALVFTAAALAANRACCGSGCRHCPYPPEEQRRAGRPGA
jgi:hypothetical protein